jgi:hypothetical protein
MIARRASELSCREAFAVVAHDLTEADALPDAVLADAERRMGCRLPAALRDFYELAGNARTVLDHHDHFLLPDKWFCDGEKVIFLSENQEVVVYAVPVTGPADDPPVFMATNETPYAWHEVSGSCSEFLRVMVHWQGSFGGAMAVGGCARVEHDIRSALEARFRFAGVVNEMEAYGAAGLAVCLVKWTDGWRIFVGASDEERLAEVDALGVDLELYDE